MFVGLMCPASKNTKQGAVIQINENQLDEFCFGMHGVRF
jgi:hypothetical protein